MTKVSSRLRTQFPLRDFSRKNFSKHLTAYATAATAAGVGVLALTTPAEAEIVYTRVNKALKYGVTLLDLNNDGIADFGFCLGTFSAREFPSSSGCTVPGGRKRASSEKRRAPSPFGQWVSIIPAATESKRNEIWANTAGAYALPAGFKVGSKLAFTPGAKVMAACFQATSSTCRGNWSTAPHRYLGLKFVINGKTHYGWARLNVTWNLSGESATLTGYAYETIPNKSIVTGDIVGPVKRKDVSQKAAKPDIRGVPTTNQGVSLGLLATGADGFVAWRRKDQDE
jgi:hypothetical protein